MLWLFDNTQDGWLPATCCRRRQNVRTYLWLMHLVDASLNPRTQCVTMSGRAKTLVGHSGDECSYSLPDAALSAHGGAFRHVLDLLLLPLLAMLPLGGDFVVRGRRGNGLGLRR
jgi:hypothetical protein